MSDVIKVWENIFSNQKQVSIYPFTDLVSLVHNHLPLMQPNSKIFELGYGFGPNIQIFKNLGFDYYGIEGSKTAYEHVKSQYPDSKVSIGDFCKPFDYGNDFFDLIVDRASIGLVKNHIKEIVSEVHRVMKVGGLFMGVDFLSKSHDFYKEIKAGKTIDRHIETFFSDEFGIKQLLKEFDIVYLRHKTINQRMPKNTQIAFYDFVAKKK